MQSTKRPKRLKSAASVRPNVERQIANTAETGGDVGRSVPGQTPPRARIGDTGGGPSRSKELTYAGAALVLGCSPRNVRRLLHRYGIKPIVRGYRTVRLPAEAVVRLKLTMVQGGLR